MTKLTLTFTYDDGTVVRNNCPKGEGGDESEQNIES